MKKNTQLKTFICTWLILCAPVVLFAQDRPLDFWDEELRIFGVAGSGENIDQGIAKNRSSDYRPKGVELDHADQVVGDLSLKFVPAKAGMPQRFGFIANLWGGLWNLTGDRVLRCWIKGQGKDISEAWQVQFIDESGRVANGKLDGISSEWRELRLPLGDLQAASDFDWKRVKLFQFEAALGRDARIQFDGIRFEGPNGAIAVTDKSLAQRMFEAKHTRELRVWSAYKSAASNEADGLYAPIRAFSKMWLNEDIKTANRILVEELENSSTGDAWSLLHTPLFCRFYYLFSSRAGKFPGRLFPETEKLLLETLWERTADKNDIHWARQSTWYLDGSENHDLNAKACNLVTSRIFMNEPDYKDRIYPDYGFGGGYHYGHAGYYGPDIDPESRHGGGRANLSDGNSYTAADHYSAWLSFLKEYFRERAGRGFFLEYGSPTYSKHSLNFVELAYQYGGDDELHSVIDGFLTLYWADWAQVSISGVRGGPKTRHHGKVHEGRGTSDLICFHLGGAGNAGPWWYWNLINDYDLPAVVWKMALDREGMGEFVYRARGIGEEENQLPRPLGTERSLVVGTDARFLKYTYVTPDYTLGTQMDHPSAIHSHLSIAGRWHGMTFAQSPDSRIVPVALTDGTNAKEEKSAYEMEIMFRTIQDQSTLIVQQSRRWFSVHPEWFPVNVPPDREVGIWFGKDWDRREEKAGWIFVQKGAAYAAVRPVLWDEAFEKAQKADSDSTQRFFNAYDAPATVKLRTDACQWNADGSILLLEDNYTIIIVEAGRKTDYATLEAFMADVLDNPIALYKTVVPGDNILVYTGNGTDAREIVFNGGAQEIPTIAGEPVNYAYPMTFDSPYLKSSYKSGKIQMAFAGTALELDFSATKQSQPFKGEKND